MRREDRVVAEISQIEEIIKTCKVFRVAMNDEDGIYILPMNFGYTLTIGADTNDLVLYFHGGKVGKKTDLLCNGAINVGFEMDCEHELALKGNPEYPCAYGYSYASVIGKGVAEVILDDAEKAIALNHLMVHQMGKDFEYTDKMLQSVNVFKLTASCFTAKRN